MIQNICRSRQTQYWLSIFVLVHNSWRTLASRAERLPREYTHKMRVRSAPLNSRHRAAPLPFLLSPLSLIHFISHSSDKKKRGSEPLQPNISTKHVKGWSHPQNKGWLHSAPLPPLSNQTHDGGLRAGGNELWDKQSWIFHKGKMVMSRLPNFLQIGRKCQGYMGVFDKT
jgi:hypothetical protein